MGLEILQPIPATHDYDGDAQTGEILLKLETPVRSHKDGEPPGPGCAKQDSVAQPDPALITNGGNLDGRELSREASRERFVNENPHR